MLNINMIINAVKAGEYFNLLLVIAGLNMTEDMTNTLQTSQRMARPVSTEILEALGAFDQTSDKTSSVFRHSFQQR
jgi:hypothetical protein